jgi:ribosome-binding protein aMBF1 (putative translation factor)
MVGASPDSTPEPAGKSDTVDGGIASNSLDGRSSAGRPRAVMQQLNDRVLAFAGALRHHRRARGLTQVELAERSQLSERAISDRERRLKSPQRATLRLLTAALALSPDEAELGTTHQPQPKPHDWPHSSPSPGQRRVA